MFDKDMVVIWISLLAVFLSVYRSQIKEFFEKLQQRRRNS